MAVQANEILTAIIQGMRKKEPWLVYCIRVMIRTTPVPFFVTAQSTATIHCVVKQGKGSYIAFTASREGQLPFTALLNMARAS